MIKRVVAFLTDVRTELGKVSWSSRQELVGSTWVVMVSSALLAMMVGVFDLICTTVVQILLR